MSVKFAFNLKQKDLKNYEDKAINEEIFLKGSNGSTIILIHGLTGTPQEMSFLAGYLNRAGFSVSCPRLANHGEPLEVLKYTRWQDCYQSVRQAYIKVKPQAKHLFVAGLSMGALLALLLAEEFPREISGVSCLSPTLFYDGWNMPWVTRFLPLVLLTPLRNFLYFKEEPPYGIKNEALRSYIHKFYSEANLDDMENVEAYGYPYFPLTLLYQLQLLVKRIVNGLAAVRVPVQLLQAKEDDMTSVKNSQFIYDRISSSIKEMVLLEDSYHVITADQQRDKVAEEMERFFKKCIT